MANNPRAERTLYDCGGNSTTKQVVLVKQEERFVVTRLLKFSPHYSVSSLR
ncbi:MAG: hypothetical protein WAO83_21120 [Fuerstiella sp.]